MPSSAMSQLLRCSSFSPNNNHIHHYSRHLLPSPNFPSLPLNPPNFSLSYFHRSDLLPFAVGGGGSGSGGHSSGGGGGGGGDDDHHHHHEDHRPDSSDGGFGPVGAFLEGWRSRVAADPQFPFKVLMEELVGVTACVIGDMASRPNFGLNELDFVFSTLVVGSILNFTLMYLLAPTSAAASATLPSIFSGCPPSHMFEPGSYGLGHRLGTFVYKGAVFAAVGFAAGLVGTALSNGLIAMRKKMDPSFETPNKAPPTLLNASTWALHMGISSNLRYQSLNGIEFVLEKVLPEMVFKTSVVFLRCMNNVLGGMSFVVLARLTGSQAAAAPPAETEMGVVVDHDRDLQQPLLVSKEGSADDHVVEDGSEHK